MRKYACSISLLLVLLFAGSVVAKNGGVVSIKDIPKTVEEFVKMRNELAVTMQGGAAMFVVAMIVYTKDEDLGMKCFTIALDRGKLTRSGAVYKGWAPRQFRYWAGRLKKMPFIPYIYVQGTSHENGYALPAEKPYQIRWHGNKYNSRKVMIANTGGNRARPIIMKKNNKGYWKAHNYNSLFVGPSRFPKKKQDNDDL